MKITKKDLPKNQAELKIEIEPKEYQEFLEKTAQKMSETTKIQGFRPGKAPYDIVKKKFGEMKILEQALDTILTHFYFEAVTKEKLEPISHPKIDIEKMVVENPLIFKATINLIPKIKVCDLNKIGVKKAKVKIDDKEIDKAIETLRENQAKEVLEDKKIEKNDKTDIDFAVSIDNVVIEGGKETNYPLVVDKGHMIPGFEENLIGKKKGAKVEFKLKFPKKYHNKNVAGKEADFKVEVKAVYKRELPKVNDEWAKTTLQSKDLKDLKDKIKKNYEAEKQKQEDKKIEIEIIDKIIKGSEIGEFSDDLIKAETHKMIEELKQNIEKQGLKFEDYLKQLGKKVEDMEKDFKEQAKKRLDSSLIMRAVIDKEKIEVTDKEISAEIEMGKQIYGSDSEMIKNLESPQYKDHLRLGLLNKKVMDFLKDKCSS
jgi:trigger factor